MEGDGRPAELLAAARPVAAQIVGRDGTWLSIGVVSAEDEGIFGQLAESELKAQFQLRLPVLSQHRNCARRQGDGAPASLRLRRLEPQDGLLRLLVPGLLQAPLDGYLRAVETDAGPGQRQHLATPAA